MKHALAFAALVAAGSAHAQDWTRFIAAPGYGTVSLIAQDGLRDDTSGRIMVGVRNGTSFTTRNAQPYAELHLFDTAGTVLAKPAVYGATGAPPLTLTPRGTSAYQGYRVAWFEVGTSTGIDDVIVAYPRDSNEGFVHRFSRSGGDRVVRVSSDGEGGVIVVRKPQSWSFPLVEKMTPASRSWRIDWSTRIGATGGACPSSAVDVLVDDADIELDRQGPAWTRINVLARCDGGVVQPDSSFIQSIDSVSGAVYATHAFHEADVGDGVAVRHALGDGAWLYESKDGDGHTQLRVADVHTGIYTLSWASLSGPVRINRLAEGGLIGAHLPDHGNAYWLNRVRRDSNGYFSISDGRLYPSLGTLADRTLHWSEDAQQRRVVAWRGSNTLPPRVHLRGFDASGNQTWQRTIGNAVRGAEPQLRYERLSGTMVMAIDMQPEGKNAGVHVEGFDPAG
jgi:hypothetical protein